MGRLRRTTEIRQAELTDAALHIIATQGIGALTTRNLAAQVGLSTGAIFKHFTTLDALLDAVVARVEAVLEATYPPAGTGPVERLERFIEARSTAVGNQLGILRLVLSEQFLLALPSHGAARLAECVRKTRAFLLACVEEGQASRSLRRDIPATALVPIIMGTVQMLALASPSARQHDLEASAVIRALLALLREQPSSSIPTARSSP
ncbi:MAG: TetR/AcrR family transcriptional regulator [Myxococcales bacterium]|nr:TetR/AcrR family transcriptional regulator [Myxococcales bacterium]